MGRAANVGAAHRTPGTRLIRHIRSAKGLSNTSRFSCIYSASGTRQGMRHFDNTEIAMTLFGVVRSTFLDNVPSSSHLDKSRMDLDQDVA